MMKPPTDRKLYLGPKLRLLRRELGVNQSQMAAELGVSASYLNHLERNQRPLTAQMLLRLAETYDLDIRDFVSGASPDNAGSLSEIFSDALVRDVRVPRDEVREIAENYPGVSEAVARLYRALVDLRRQPDADQIITPQTSSALAWLRDFTQAQGNYFADLDRAAEALTKDLPDDPAERFVTMRLELEEAQGISVRVMDEKAMGGARRLYDLHRRRVMIAERLPPSGRLFAVATQWAMASLHEQVAAIIDAAQPDEAVRPTLRAMLTNYAAAAIVMPYGRFFKAAEESRYDMDLLTARFGASYEQVAHRLTTLARSGERGAPVFLLKIDISGNISKRFAGEGMPLAQFGGSCPRWSLFRAFHGEGSVAEIVEMPGGERYVTLSRRVPHSLDPDARSIQAIAIGCDIKHAPRLGFADGLMREKANPIGPACHLCERIGCPDRALPPVNRRLSVNQYQRGASPFPFEAV